MKFNKLSMLIILTITIFSCSTAYKTVSAKMPDLTLIENGIYRGNYDMVSTPVKATVDVVVHDHQIIKIDIVEHSSSPIGKKAERIIDNIISSQSLDVDVISGATVSSKTILKAVENAIQ